MRKPGAVKIDARRRPTSVWVAPGRSPAFIPNSPPTHYAREYAVAINDSYAKFPRVVRPPLFPAHNHRTRHAALCGVIKCHLPNNNPDRRIFFHIAIV